jgi:hypothetical protein
LLSGKDADISKALREYCFRTHTVDNTRVRLERSRIQYAGISNMGMIHKTTALSVDPVWASAKRMVAVTKFMRKLQRAMSN